LITPSGKNQNCRSRGRADSPAKAEPFRGRPENCGKPGKTLNREIEPEKIVKRTPEPSVWRKKKPFAGRMAEFTQSIRRQWLFARAMGGTRAGRSEEDQPKIGRRRVVWLRQKGRGVPVEGIGAAWGRRFGDGQELSVGRPRQRVSRTSRAGRRRTVLKNGAACIEQKSDRACSRLARGAASGRRQFARWANCEFIDSGCKALFRVLERKFDRGRERKRSLKRGTEWRGKEEIGAPSPEDSESEPSLGREVL